MKISREDIVKEVRSYVGTPFAHQGRTPKKGLDCVGVPISVCLKFKIPFTDKTDYPKMPRPEMVRAGLEENLLPLGKFGWKQGCVLRMYTGRNMPKLAAARALFVESRARHVVVVTSNGYVHADFDIGRVVESGLSDDFRERIAEAYDFPGVFDPWPV